MGESAFLFLLLSLMMTTSLRAVLDHAAECKVQYLFNCNLTSQQTKNFTALFFIPQFLPFNLIHQLLSLITAHSQRAAPYAYDENDDEYETCLLRRGHCLGWPAKFFGGPAAGPDLSSLLTAMISTKAFIWHNARKVYAKLFSVSYIIFIRFYLFPNANTCSTLWFNDDHHCRPSLKFIEDWHTSDRLKQIIKNVKNLLVCSRLSSNILFSISNHWWDVLYNCYFWWHRHMRKQLHHITKISEFNLHKWLPFIFFYWWEVFNSIAPSDGTVTVTWENNYTSPRSLKSNQPTKSIFKNVFFLFCFQ